MEVHAITFKVNFKFTPTQAAAAWLLLSFSVTAHTKAAHLVFTYQAWHWDSVTDSLELSKEQPF